MALKSWVTSANDPQTDFPLANLPYGVFQSGAGGLCLRDEKNRIGVAIGDRILDLHACAQQGLLDGLSRELATACCAKVLNPLMSLGAHAWSALRHQLTSILGENASGATRERVEKALIAMSEAAMLLPAEIGDYTDFYASIHHATRVGKRFRPENPLLPNYKYVPIGYHGRASSIVVSGTPVRRPCGQIKSPSAAEPAFAPSQSLDYELEVGIFIGPGNPQGQTIPIAEAEQHIFGLCLMNDWSARDMQSWEYQPLGPFLAKSFATTISPWVVPLEALAPYRLPAPPRPLGDPEPLAYLSPPVAVRGALDVTLEVHLQSRRMRQAGAAPMLLSKANLRDLYWTIAQLVTHHASNGCNLRPGDLLATGTISGAEEGSEGCLLEKLRDGESVRLHGAETRRFLEEGDRVSFSAYTAKEGLPRIGFGKCVGMVA